MVQNLKIFLHKEPHTSVSFVINCQSLHYIKCPPKHLNVNVTQSFTATRYRWGCSGCLFISVTLGLFTSPILNKCASKWNFPVTNLAIILSWFLLKLTNAQTFFQRGFSFKKFPQTDNVVEAHAKWQLQLWCVRCCQKLP